MSGEVLLDPSVDFPEMEKFEPPNKLPSVKSVIGVLKFLASPKEAGRYQFTQDQALMEVTKSVFSKWYHDTIYCLPMSTIKRRVGDIWAIYREGSKRLQRDRMSSEAVKK